ncbi:cytochrome c biogenesis protein ResB [Nocardioides pocheonensis]|nr:cytochrome c biogenesis protein ResB [Nocardioides pocheonensis]
MVSAGSTTEGHGSTTEGHGSSTGRSETTGREGMGSAPADPGAAPLAPREFLRWAWRQLTSMRTALILLFLLALAAVPGSVVPQEAVDATKASQWRENHHTLAPIYQKLGLFSVYDSAWFSAIYLLLMVSLVGCILPRTRVYWKALRARPPAAPRNLSRLPEHRAFETSASPEQVLERARGALRGYRVVSDVAEVSRLAGARTSTTGGEELSLSAERGKLREAGNLLFHLSILVVLVGFAGGALLGYKGGVIVVTGNTFANSLSQYDDFRPGSLFKPSGLAPFDFKVTDFDVTFIKEGREAGMAHKFSAGLDYRTSPGAATRHTRISVNHPLTIDGTKIYLISHGYAPHITVRDATGAIAYSGPVVFLPEDNTFKSWGVVKVPDAQGPSGPEQLGLEGELYPTYAFTDATGPFSAFPDDKNPALSMLAYQGDLGLDDGVPQSVYALDKKGLKPILKPDGKPLRVDLMLNQTVTLPDGMGSVTFDGMSRFVKLQVSRSPGDLVALGGVVLALLGLLGSLFIRPRRVWVKVRRDGGGPDRRTLVEVAGLDRSAGGDLAGEIDQVVASLRGAPQQEPVRDEEQV